MASNSQILPNDILFEILTSLNLDDLRACRQVNRECYQLTNEKSFKLRHYVKTNTVSGYIIGSNLNYSFVTEYPIKCPLESLGILKKHTVRIEAVSQCRGLILCFDGQKDKEQYYVCKPTTGQCRAIPNPNLQFCTATAAMVASTSGPVEFKIIRFSSPKENRRYIVCEIFDSRTWSWSKSKFITVSDFFPHEGYRLHDRAVFANGALHWLIKDRMEDQIFIFAFDIEKETWKLIPVPPNWQASPENNAWVASVELKWRCRLTVQEGKLCCTMLKDLETMNVWTMEIYNTKPWWRRETLKLKEANKVNRGWLEFYLEFFYCSGSGSFNEHVRDIWDNFWKSKLNKFGLKYFFVGDVFKIESDFEHCECLDSKSSASSTLHG